MAVLPKLWGDYQITNSSLVLAGFLCGLGSSVAGIFKFLSMRSAQKENQNQGGDSDAEY